MYLLADITNLLTSIAIKSTVKVTKRAISLWSGWRRCIRSGRLSGSKPGYVDLVFNVDENGRLTDTEVARGDPEGVFDKAAISALKQFRYLPRIRDGQAVSVYGVKTTMRFELVD